MVYMRLTTAAHDRCYRETYFPIALKIPGMRRCDVIEKSLASEDGRASAGDVPNLPMALTRSLRTRLAWPAADQKHDNKRHGPFEYPTPPAKC